MTPSRIIKKYPNRRLYDTEISSYITLEDVRQLIVDGEQFVVRDARSGADLTRQVLMQIISEHEEHGQPIFSTELLTQVIRFRGDALQGAMSSFLDRSLQFFLEQQQTLRGQLGNLATGGPWSLLNSLAERNMELWKSLSQGLGVGTGSNPTPPPARPRLLRARDKAPRKR
jgi:polyhydroxyalkanoate synthesis repressor PhaR